MKRSITIFLCLALLFSSVLIGCTGGGDPAGKETGTQTTAPAAQTEKTEGDTASSSEDASLKLPLVDPGSVTLRIGTYDNWYAPASYSQNLEIFKEIEKDTGVKIEWEVVPDSQYRATMQTRLAAGTDLPDIINVPSSFVKYCTDGLLIPIDELIEQHAPNIEKYFAADPLTKKILTNPNGRVYGLAFVVSGTNESDPYAWIARKDWLDRVGVKEPSTIDEFYTMLKAFKEKDANGNGDPNDEIPLTTRYGVKDLARFGDSWGLHLFFSEGLYADSNGKVSYDWVDPRAKELVAWLNKLYKEGLIDEEFLSTGDDARLSKITRNIIGTSTHFINAIDEWDKVLIKAGVADANHIALVPPVGPNGYKGHQESYGPVSDKFAITKDCKNPEVAIKWLDYVFASEQGFLYTTFGIEGKSYEMVNGEPQYTKWATSNPEGLPLASALRSLGALPTIPFIRSNVGYWSKQNLASIAHLPKTVEAAKKINPYLIASYPPLLATAEESAILSSKMNDINTYRDEHIAKLIMGQESIDDWDKIIVEGLKNAGLEEVIKVRQQQYDRFKK